MSSAAFIGADLTAKHAPKTSFNPDSASSVIFYLPKRGAIIILHIVEEVNSGATALEVFRVTEKTTKCIH